jgi:hypothetical protein
MMPHPSGILHRGKLRLITRIGHQEHASPEYRVLTNCPNDMTEVDYWKSEHFRSVISKPKKASLKSQNHLD